jgi:uridine kinase
MKDKKVRIICENEGHEIYVAQGTSLARLAEHLREKNPNPWLAAYVDNKIK